MKKKEEKKVIYAEVKPHIIEKLQAICDRYGLPKNQAIGLAISYLDQEKPKIKITGK